MTEPPAPPVAGTPLTPSSLGSAPAGAAAVFGDRLSRAVHYATLLATWGVERGLIGPREPARIWERHLLNSAALAGAVPADADVVDLGSGAGLPGIPLALARPDLRLLLVEPMQRRADFLREVAAVLELDLGVLCARAEAMPTGSADVVVARAVAPLDRLIPWALPVLRTPGTLLALKGRSAEAEVAGARSVLRKWSGTRASVGTVAYEGATARVVRIDRDRERRREAVTR